MEKGFSKIELIITTALMMTIASGFMSHIHEAKKKILKEGVRVYVKYEEMQKEEDEGEDMRDSIIRKLVRRLELSEEEHEYVRQKGLYEEA